MNARTVVGLASSDVLFGAITALGVAAIAAAVFAVRPRTSNRAGTRKGSSGWDERVAAVCAAGREVLDLAAAHDSQEPGIGLTTDQLGEMETKLDQLIGQTRDIQSIAPSHEAGHQMVQVARHATLLNEAVRTERRIRLSSIEPKDQRLATIALEFVAERSALDDVLSAVSKRSGPRT